MSNTTSLVSNTPSASLGSSMLPANTTSTASDQTNQGVVTAGSQRLQVKDVEYALAAIGLMGLVWWM